MKFWIVNPFDELPNEVASPQRFWTLCRELAKRGHEVTWWSMNFNHRLKKFRSPCEKTEGFQIRLLEVPPYYRNVGFQRIKNHRIFGEKFLEAAREELRLENAEMPTIILSLPPLDTPYAAVRLKNEFPNLKVVVDMMDAWPEVLVRLMCRRLPFLKWSAKLILRNYYKMLKESMRQADAISAQSQSFADFACQNGFSGAPHVVYLGSELTPREILEKKWSTEIDSQNKKLRLVYVGAMGRIYDLPTLYKAIAGLKNSVSLSLDIAGGTTEDVSRHSAMVASMGIAEQVRFHGFIGHQELEKLLLNCDLALIPMFNESMVACPYKAGTYAGAGLPMINSLDSEMRVLIEKYGAGYQYQAGNVESLRQAILHFCDNFSELKRMGKNSRQMADDCFDKNRIYSEWAKWLESISLSK